MKNHLLTPEKGRRTYRPKRFGNNNKDEENSPKTLNDKNHQALCQKFWQLSRLKGLHVPLLHEVKLCDYFI